MRPLLIAALLALTPLAVGAQDSGIAVGSPAPVVSVEGLDGKPMDLGRYVGIAVPMNQSVERVRRYGQAHGIRHEILYDREGAAIDAYEVPATSYIVVIDRKGTVVYTGVGGDQDLEAAIRRDVNSMDTRGE